MNDIKKTVFQKNESIKIPQKSTINLVIHEKSTQTMLTLILGSIIIAVLVFCVAKFAVFDQYARLDKAEQEYDAVSSQAQQLESVAATYNEVLFEYRTHAKDWVTSDSTVNVDRQAVLNLLETEVMPCGTVTSVALQGNVMTVEMSGLTLQKVSEMRTSMLQSPIVASVSVNTAASESDTQASVVDVKLTVNLHAAAQEEN